MNYAKEIIAPYLLSPHDQSLPVIGRVNVDKPADIEQFLTLSHSDATALLYKSSSVHPSRFLEQWTRKPFIDDFVNKAKILFAHNHRRIALAADNDSLLHQMLSPRYAYGRSIEERTEPLLALYKAISCLMEVEVFLTVEDLSPGGLDATEGISIAVALEKTGLKKIIATSGTQNFPILFDRRPTRKKRPELKDFYSNEPSLAAAIWLQEHTDLEVHCSAFIDDPEQALLLAQNLGLAGLIEKAQIEKI
jgi:2,4-dienoyl-CoA reductase-like NADH-dependent reductase (Old Yellow Enzyme family)